jgi:nucleotide-binding universal stress UspA family protein
MFKRILVPVDGSAASMKGLDMAIELAKSHGSQLRLIHVVNELVLGVEGTPTYSTDLIQSLREGGNALLKDAEAHVRERALESQTVLLESIGGRAANLIIDQARQWPADLIVMGTHGRRGLGRLALGSDAEMVLRSTPVPILLVREGE